MKNNEKQTQDIIASQNGWMEMFAGIAKAEMQMKNLSPSLAVEKIIWENPFSKN